MIVNQTLETYPKNYYQAIKNFLFQNQRHMSRSINLQKEDSAKSLPELLRKENANENVFLSIHLNQQFRLLLVQRQCLMLHILQFMKEGKQATLYAKLAQVKSHHKLKLLEKSFVLEKQRIVKEIKEAENMPVLAKLETHFNGVLLSKTSNALIKMSKDYSNKYHLHDKINVTSNHVNSNTKIIIKRIKLNLSKYNRLY